MLERARRLGWKRWGAGLLGVLLIEKGVVTWRHGIDWHNPEAFFWLGLIPAGAAYVYCAVTGKWMRAGRSGPADSN
jgi:hypothetical protein